MSEPKRKPQEAEVIPLYGRDEMNLIEFPFGPVTKLRTKTLQVEHPVFDRRLKREVTRKLIITGSDAFGLPRPIDDQVLVGLMALTHEAGYASRKVEFSRYHLCRILGWPDDGRSYRRIEESFDRIAGTTLKFRDAWWDKGNEEWQSQTFHLIENVSLCSKDGLDRARLKTGRVEQTLCSFTWNEIVWKSFQDGFIKSLDMDLFRRIAKGKRREVALRLFRILDKRFHKKTTAQFDLRQLCVGKLGLSPKYTPFEMLRVLERAVKWLNECGYQTELCVPDGKKRGTCEVVFLKQPHPGKGAKRRRRAELSVGPERIVETDEQDTWLAEQSEDKLLQLEHEALQSEFGTKLERDLVRERRASGTSFRDSGPIRQLYVRKYIESLAG